MLSISTISPGSKSISLTVRGTLLLISVIEPALQRYSHTAVAFGDCILILGGARQKTTFETKEEEKREKDGDKDHWGKESTASENDMVEKLQFREKKYEFNDLFIFHPGISATI